MRYFHKFCQGIETMYLMQQIMRQPELWDQQRLRTTHPGTPHSEVSDIWLRFNRLPEVGNEALVLDEHESINWPAFDALPAARAIVFDLMRAVEGERLGRVLITRLAPGKRIAPHVDGGSHAVYYDRYHVGLQIRPGALFRAGNETVQMATGDCWWFDNSQEHEVINNSDDDRITLIVDIRTRRAP